MGDEAIIAWRSWDVLAEHGPLLGQYTQASVSSGRPVFSPGPLLYWALTVPTHLAPGIGPAVAALLLSGLAVVLACVAAARTWGRTAAVATAGGALLLQWSLAPQLTGAPVWNPYIGLMPFAAVLLLAWVTGSGRTGWLPALALLATFCVHTHLMFAPAAAAAVLGAGLGLAFTPDRRRSLRRHLPLAGFVTLLCWLPAIWQQVTRPPGNLGLLVGSTAGSSDATVGSSFALAALVRALQPPPVWLRPYAPTPAADSVSVAGVITLVAVVVALVLVLLLGLRRRRPTLVAGPVVALAAGAMSTWVIASVVVARGSTAVYIVLIVWPVGILVWAVLLGAVGSVLVTSAWSARAATTLRRGGPATATVVLVVAAVVLVPRQYGQARESSTATDGRPFTADAVAELAALIGSPVSPGQRLAVRVPASVQVEQESLRLGLLYRLRTRGWEPAVESPLCVQFAPTYCQRDTDAVLTLGGEGAVPAGERIGQVVGLPGGGFPRYDVYLLRNP